MWKLLGKINMEALGVSLQFLKEIRDIIDQPLLSTQEVSVVFDEWCDSENSSLAQLVNIGYSACHFPNFRIAAGDACGKANVYVCHCRNMRFTNLLKGLEEFNNTYNDTSTNDSIQLFFWIDIMCFNKRHDATRRLIDTISSIGHTLLVLPYDHGEITTEEINLTAESSSINETTNTIEDAASISIVAESIPRLQSDADPEFMWNDHPLCHAWCLWELAISAFNSCELSIQGSKDRMSEFVHQRGSLFAERAYLHFAIAFSHDKDVLTEISEAYFPNGVSAVDGIVMNYLEEWIAAKKLEIAAAVDSKESQDSLVCEEPMDCVDGAKEISTQDPEMQQKCDDLSEDPNKVSIQKLDMKSEDDLFFTCPYEDCEGYIVISPKQVNCGVFRHAVIKTTGRAVNPHASREKCEELLKQGKVYGCARPFKLRRIKKSTETFVAIEKCGWI